MNEELANLNLNDEAVINRIYVIRGIRIMLDRDLASLYEVETRVLKQAVRRNISRFPEDFMFEMSSIEFESWKREAELSDGDKKGLRYAPLCFTEQGVAMLSSVLKSDRAIQVNIQIIRVFSKIREMLTDTLNLKLDMDDLRKKVESQDKNIELVFSYLTELSEKQDNPEPRKKVGYKRKDEED